MSILPFWNDFYKDITYTLEQFKDTEQLQLWKDCGHNIEKISIGLHQYNNDNSLTESVKLLFPNLKHIGVCIHKLSPGHYLPMHSDKYAFYANKYNVTDLNLIKRHIIFLEDCEIGHMLIVKDRVYSNWKRGDVASWQGTDMHSAINLGMTDRYTLQITGIDNAS